MNHIVKYIAKNRSGIPLNPVGITLHETATPGATAENSFQYFNREQVGASAHVFVDWNERLQMVPYHECAWHAGPAANSRYIGVEMCHPRGHNPEQFKRVWDGTVELFAELCKTYGFTAEQINTHHEISLRWGETDHVDPTSFLAEYGEDINSFKKAVNEKLNGGLTMTQYEELTRKYEKIIEILDKQNPVYHYTVSVPEWGRPTVQKLLDKGILKGESEADLNLSEGMLRVLVINDRAGLYD